MANIRGVNLGTWLVLEKWMKPELFSGTTAEDETELCLQLGNEKYARLKEHRDTFITLEDFRYIASKGFNAVRIPVPHFIFDDCEPYVGCIEYLDRAFDWAEETGLQILIDLHTARDCQNGFDNGGIAGVCKWHLKQENIDHTVSVLARLAERYMDRKALYGIELLNEPVSEEFWPPKLPPHDPERAKGSCPVPDEVLRRFYTDAYFAIRRYLKDDKVIMFHDGFRLKHWKDFMQGDEFKNVVIDTHMYMGLSVEDRKMSMTELLSVVEGFDRDIEEMSRYFPIVVGEWCLLTPVDSIADENETSLGRDAIIRAMSAAQLHAFEKAYGWFFWTYKVTSEVQGWDVRKAIEHGWLPESLA